MARTTGKAAGLLVDEFDFSGISNNCTMSFVSTPAEVTAFADTDVTYVQGKPGFTFDVTGYGLRHPPTTMERCLPT